MARSVHLQLRYALANVLEETAARMFARERVQGHVHGQAPHLDIAVRRPRHKVLLVRIYRQTLDRVIVSLILEETVIITIK